MKISAIPHYNINFSSSIREVYNSNKNDKANSKLSNSKILYSNYTYFFRYDLNLNMNNDNWKQFRKIIASEFKDTPKVNVYNFASSDGSEAYSFVISMIEELGEEEAQKFFPVKAYDIDKEITDTAKNKRIPCDYDDITRINLNTENHINKYFKINTGDIDYDNYIRSYDLELIPKSIIKETVNFKQADIRDEIDNIEPDNSLILCRNFWPYLDENSRNDTIEKLIDKINSSSIIVFGAYEMNNTSFSAIINSKLNSQLKFIEKYIFRKT